MRYVEFTSFLYINVFRAVTSRLTTCIPFSLPLGLQIEQKLDFLQFRVAAAVVYGLLKDSL